MDDGTLDDHLHHSRKNGRSSARYSLRRSLVVTRLAGFDKLAFKTVMRLDVVVPEYKGPAGRFGSRS
jgi:hypothetical protein